VSREIELELVRGGVQHDYIVKIPYGERDWLDVRIELTEEETSQTPEFNRPRVLNSALSILLKSVGTLQEQVDDPP